MSDTPKYCTECAHFNLPDGPTDWPECRHPANTASESPVKMRQPQGACGASGVLWLAKA